MRAAVRTHARMEAAYASHFQRFVDFAGSGISSAWCFANSTRADSIRILMKRGQRDGPLNKSRSVLQSYNFDIVHNTLAATFPIQIDGSVLCVSPSPSGKWLAVMRKDDTAGAADAGAGGPKKVSLELWSSRGSCVRSIPASSIHGDPINDGWFSSSEGLSWSPDERMCVYVAERKVAHADKNSITEMVKGAVGSAVMGTPSTFKGLEGPSGQAGVYGPDLLAASPSGSPAALGGSGGGAAGGPSGMGEEPAELTSAGQYDFVSGGREDWGEKYVGVRSPGLFVVDWSVGAVVPLPGIPHDTAAGQPAWVPEPQAKDGQGTAPQSRWLVYTGWPAGTGRRLGMIYCYNRPCALYTVDVAGVLQEAQARAQRAFDGPLAGQEKTTNGASAPSGSKPKPLPSPVHYCLTGGEPISRSPRPKPDGRTIAYLSMSGSALHTHNGASALKVLDWAGWLEQRSTASAAAGSMAASPSPSASLGGQGTPAAEAPTPAVQPSPKASTSTVLPVVQWPDAAPQAPVTVAPSLQPSWFASLYAHGLPTCTWAPDGHTLLVNAHKGSVGTVYAVDTATGKATEPFLEAMASPAASAQGLGGAASLALHAVVSVQDAAGSKLLALCTSSTPSSPDQLVLFQSSPTAGSNGGSAGFAQATWTIAVAEGSMTNRTDAEGLAQAFPAVIDGQQRAESKAVSISGPGGNVLPAPYLSWSESAQRVLTGLAGIRWQVMPVYARLKGFPSHHLGNDGGESLSQAFESIILRPTEDASGTDRPARPLVVVPHGGPHSAFTTTFLLPYAYLVSLGYVVVLVNYRGSTGYGEGPLSSLPGRCGDVDVDDCYTATLLACAAGGVRQARDALQTATVTGAVEASAARNLAVADQLQSPGSPCHGLRIDPTRVVVAGGSHGGFLSFHLMAYPARLREAVKAGGRATGPDPAPISFSASVIRNPVTNIMTMAGSTDIPDWCWTEAMGIGAWPAWDGGQDGQHGNGHGQPVLESGCTRSAAVMLASSPMAHFEHIAAALPGVQAAAQAGAGNGSAANGPSSSATDPSTAPASGGCAVMLMLGLKDRRVPPSQGLEMFHALRARLGAAQMKLMAGGGAGSVDPSLFGWRSLRMLTLPEDVHALDRPATEAESWPAIAAWLHAVLKL